MNTKLLITTCMLIILSSTLHAMDGFLVATPFKTRLALSKLYMLSIRESITHEQNWDLNNYNVVYGLKELPDEVETLAWHCDRQPEAFTMILDNKKNTPLMTAITHGNHRAVVLLLIRYIGSKDTSYLNHVNGDGRTPMDIACALKDTKAQILLKHADAIQRAWGNPINE